MQHLDEGTIHSWLDGALSADEAARVEGHVAECPRCAAAVAEARGFIAAASRILMALDNAPPGVIPAAAPRKRVDPLVWRMAAAVLILAVGTLVTARSHGGNDRVMSASTDTASPSRHATSFPTQIAPAIPPTASTDNRGARAAATNPPAGGVSGQIAPRPGATLHEGESKALAAGREPHGQAATASDIAEGGALAVAPPEASRDANSPPMSTASEPERFTVVTPTRRISTNVSVTLYEVAPGDTVTFMELGPLSQNQAGVTTVATPSVAREATGRPAAMSKARANTAIAAAPESQVKAQTPLSPSTISASAPEQAGNNTIKWTDPATGNTLMLTGRLPESRLQGIRIRIERERAAAAVKKGP